MGFDERPSPARVSAAAAAKLPRAVLLGLVVAYIASGLFGRDPWLDADATGFGLMWTMAHGAAIDWWLPNVAGEALAAEGPLAFWVGAAAIRLGGAAIGDVAAARLTALLWFVVATAALWYATLRLARRDEAQPVAFAFGGQASTRDYGRMLADIALLLALGTIGPVLGLHETTAAPASFAAACLALYALTVALERPYAGALLAGCALGALLLARGVQPGLWLVASAGAAVACTQPRARRLRAAALMLAVAAAVYAIWPLLSLAAPEPARAEYFAAWRAAARADFALPDVEKFAWVLRALPWYTWPLWPLAAWALYAWRHGLRHPHIAVPALLAAGQLLALATTSVLNLQDLLYVVVPLVPLAAFGAISLRRAAENAIDWFAISTFCLLGLALWAYFFAMHAGVPPKMNTSVLRLTAGFVPPLELPQIAVAAAAIGLWIALVVWRFRSHHGALWRGPLLAASGLIVLWINYSSLFTSAVNHRRSFVPLARAAAAQVAGADGADACVTAHQLRPAHRAVFAFSGPLRFGGDCRFVLHRDLAASLLDDAPPAGGWQQIWQGHRPGRKDEQFRLYRRAADR